MTSSQDLRIDLSKKLCPQDSTGDYDGHGQKVIQIQKRLEESTYTLAGGRLRLGRIRQL